MNIWKQLPEPFFALAPMEGVTDAAFRQVVVTCGKPDVFYTEFVNVEGLMSEKGKPKLEEMLIYQPEEQPIVVQLWGLEPNNYFMIAKEMVERGFAGVDINMGCPVKDVTKKGAGGAMINNPSLARDIIQAVKEGVGGKIPVSVKTRIGYKTIVSEDWIGFLLQQNLDALTVHGRTVKEQSLVPCHWDEIGKVVKLRNEISPDTVIMGNGDVVSVDQGRILACEYGVDGVMIGRGIFHNPWLFSNNQELRTKEQRIGTLLFHVRKYEEMNPNPKVFDPLKRFFKIYIQGFNGASYIREQLMVCKNYQEVYELLK